MWPKTILKLLLLCINPALMAEPAVLFDSGKTQALQNPQKSFRYQYPPPKNLQPKYSGLPVSTPSMTPGKVPSRKINRPYLNQPVFIVGADTLSLAWLTKHRQQLKKNHATGIAVNVKTQMQLDQLIQSAGGLPVNPVSGEKIARQLGLKHYPVLVSATRIEQ